MLELGDVESTGTRFVLYVIAENTFNDSFRCVLTQDQMAYEAGRMSVRSLRRQLNALSGDGDGKTPFIKRTPRFDCTGKRIEDAIEILGFDSWYLERTQNRRGRHRGEARVAEGVGDKLSGTTRTICPGVPDTAMSGGTGQQESGHKEDRTSNRTSEDARQRASEVSNLDLEGKGVRDRLRKALGGPKFAEWLSDMAFREGSDGVAVATSPVKLKADWAIRHFSHAILAACQAEWPGVRTVTIRHGTPHTSTPEAA